ncbi:TPA: integrase, partial [Pseudomonas aeruginosa]|nr:integrase [Pseudomonas aeruginosa]
NRADYIERRRPMMVWWSAYIQKAATGSLLASAYGQTRDRNVVPSR